MKELLTVLAEWLVFFFVDGRYRIVDSGVGSSFGNATITVSSSALTWRLVRDRSQIFLDCRPKDGKGKYWYSTDLLVRLLEGGPVVSAVLTEETAGWIKANLAAIEARFAPGSVEQTVADLADLKRRRAKEMFG